MNQGTLEWLQDWFAQECDGDWEHDLRVRIENLDNPGWRVDIDFSDTELEGRAFSGVHDLRSEHSWIICRIEGTVFKGRGGPSNLGEILETFRSWVQAVSYGTSAQPFQFTGQQQDDNGLIDLRARYYDPTVGRFLSRDPLAGSLLDPLSLNGYTYVANNPASLVDPSGTVGPGEPRGVYACFSWI